MEVESKSYEKNSNNTLPNGSDFKSSSNSCKRTSIYYHILAAHIKSANKVLKSFLYFYRNAYLL